MNHDECNQIDKISGILKQAYDIADFLLGYADPKRVSVYQLASVWTSLGNLFI